jgi:L-lactate utilization protein LutB
MSGNRDWEEFRKRADTARQKVIETLVAMLEAANFQSVTQAEVRA